MNSFKLSERILDFFSAIISQIETSYNKTENYHQKSKSLTRFSQIKYKSMVLWHHTFSSLCAILIEYLHKLITMKLKEKGSL